MTAHRHHVGAYVWGAPTEPRALVRHDDLLSAYADGVMADRDEDREAYLSHYVYGAEMVTHYAAHRHSVAGYVGPCWARWLVLDIDRADPIGALADARRLVAAIRNRYGTEDVPVWFSGAKGYHVALELLHAPPPSVDFPRVARSLAEAIARAARVTIDTAIYDAAHIIRLPNTRHPRTGLFKRRIDADALFALDADGIRRHAAHPAGDGIPTAGAPSAQLAADWRDAERDAARATVTRAAARRDAGPADARAPRYLVDMLRFGVREGERHATLFRCSAWLAEQGAPPSLVAALLTESGCDSGLSPADVSRQIACGIAHAVRQRGPTIDEAHAERWAIQHEADPLPAGAINFPFGGAAPGPYDTDGGRR